jgi:hypothetical protein
MKRSEFLNRLVGISGLGFLSVPEIADSRKIYLLQSFVAGFRFYKGMELLPNMQQNDIIELRRQPDNEHDEFAVALYWQQEMIGYLPATSNEIIARLMDAAALQMVGVITHLEHNAKPWENVAVAVYFLQQPARDVPVYLTSLQKPVYTTLKKDKKPKPDYLPDVFEYDERVIELEGIPDEAAKAYFSKYYKKHELEINGRYYVKVPDNGIYTYLYNVEAKGWIETGKGERLLEFIFND